MGGMKVNNVTSRVVLLGDNHFESGFITLPAGATLAEGAVLKRGAGNKEFAIATAADEYVAINPFEIKNDNGVSKAMGFRACMDGRVRKDMLRVGAAAVTVADCDKLRNKNILPVEVTDISHLDNQ
jgi:hypothetical protein